MALKAIEAMTLAELGDELNSVVYNSRQVLERAEKDGRNTESLNAAETEEISGLHKTIAPIKELMAKKQKAQTVIADLMDAESLLGKANPSRTPGQMVIPGNERPMMTWKPKQAQHLQREFSFTNVYGAPEYNQAFKSWMRGSEWRSYLARNPALMAASIGMNISDEERGGFFTCSEAFGSEIIKNVDDAVFMQGMSRVIMMPAGAQSYGVRVRTQKASSFVFSNENTEISSTFDKNLKYGKRVITPNKFQGATVISKDLLRNYPGAEGMIIGELAINASEVLEQAYLYGDGNQKPLGVMTASNDGIDASRDLPTALTGGALSFDDFVQLKYNLKTKYRGGAHWMMHRYRLRDIALLKDAEGRYLWEPSRQIGSPDSILGLAFTESEWMPTATTSGGYHVILGDFQYYYVIWDMAMEMQRLVEMRAYTDEFVYLFRCKLDAAPVLPEAFTRGYFQ